MTDPSPVRRILCPVDFSAPSRRAIEYAVDLAERLGAELHLLHVFQIPSVALPDGALIAGERWTASILDQAQRDLDRLTTEHAHRRVKIVPHVVQGIVHREIDRVAIEDLGAELIVMGTHDRGPLGRVFVGSVAERVVRTSRCPVLAVRGS
jgi:nucleotide-binding universal stress UspA family protein